ncbi:MULTISPECIES: 3,4-dihydroxy-2-butanone-4-phosphate synthase [Candidatus Ichthyocystis]|uniref:3,4-dihydroxy-2-butanone-4-phosphate synthase n=1 Tax=Candidatus Ichthyocystis TaxID=2929841 RepID=UPI000A937BCC|nr:MULTISPECIES: 3,4-dihydroxy-2-butanone-4-phosphate synthase [Ichthyocystis]
MPVSSIQEVLSDFSKGKMVVIVDDIFRENEGDLVIAADFVTPEAINFMAIHGRGCVCVPLSGEMCDRLNFYPMVPTSPLGSTAFTVAVDASSGITTGMSAHDRYVTVYKMLSPDAVPDDFKRPGHVFPLRAFDGGVLVRSGHTEASVDLCRAANLSPAAVICEVINDDGSMSRLPDLEKFALRHGLKIGLIEELVDYRLNNEQILSFSDEFSLCNNISVRQYCDLVDGCVWCVVCRSDALHGEGDLLISKGFFGDVSMSEDVSATLMKRMNGLLPEEGTVGLFRLIKGSLGMLFKDLSKISSLDVMFKRTEAALDFIAKDVSLTRVDLSFDDWKACFDL